jgi:hypothetical protein
MQTQPTNFKTFATSEPSFLLQSYCTFIVMATNTNALVALTIRSWPVLKQEDKDMPDAALMRPLGLTLSNPCWPKRDNTTLRML